jgi:hypothetical protein
MRWRYASTGRGRGYDAQQRIISQQLTRQELQYSNVDRQCIKTRHKIGFLGEIRRQILIPTVYAKAPVLTHAPNTCMLQALLISGCYRMMGHSVPTQVN